MPLIAGAKPGSRGFRQNIETEIKMGHKPPKQAVAIAYNESHKPQGAGKMKHHERAEHHMHKAEEHHKKAMEHMHKAKMEHKEKKEHKEHKERKEHKKKY